MERSLGQGHPAEARGGGDRSPPSGLSFRHYHFVLWGLHLPRMPGRKRAHQEKLAASKWQNRAKPRRGERAQVTWG